MWKQTVTFFIQQISVTNNIRHHRNVHLNGVLRTDSLVSLLLSCSIDGMDSERKDTYFKKRKLEEVNWLRNQRKIRKNDTTQYMSSSISAQIIGNGKLGAPTSLYVFTDNEKYLFNCGEGTQRLCSEYKAKLSSVEHIFITNNSWKNLGGLPGLVLTVYDMGVPELTVHSPPGIENMFDKIRHFAPIEGMQINHQNSLKDTFNDGLLKVESVPLTSGTSTISSFVCMLPAKKGALLPEKCAELGLNPGPEFAKLKAGQSVVLSDGTLIQHADVCEPDQPEYFFIVLECPNKDYLPSLLKSSQFLEIMDKSPEHQKLLFVAHFSSVEAMNDSRYQEWMKKFPTDTKHLILNDLCNDSGSNAIHRMQYKLNMIDENIFPALKTLSIKAHGEVNGDTNVILGETMMTHVIWPHVELRRSEQPFDINFDECRNQLEEISGLEEALTVSKQKLNSIEDDRSRKKFPKVLFLGTGSSIPSKARNTSGILVQISNDVAMLLDCGEGTLNQMYHFYGNDEFYNMLAILKAVYISHMHADHHIGVISFLLERAKMFALQNKPIEHLILFVPKTIIPWLKYFDEIEPLLQNVTLITNCQLMNERSSDVVLQSLSLKQIQTTYVHHCYQAFGVSLITGSNCNLLIHEATMENGLESEAKCKMHCTLSQAIRIGKEMNAEFILLTHFSQRYARIPMIGDLDENVNVGVAYDFMIVSQMKIIEIHVHV